MASIAERIKEALQIRNMIQADLVAKTGIGKSSISTYISGEYEPKQRNIYKIANALNVSEAWLMGYDVPMERGGFGAFDPVLPPHMQGVNLDGAKIDIEFLNYMLSGLSNIDRNTAKYINTRNNILAIAETSGLSKIAIDFINKIEKNAPAEKEILLHNYDSLNQDGKDKLIEYSNDLCGNPKYTEKTYNIKIAARNGQFEEKTITDSDLKKIMDLPDVDDLK